jgi:multiple sugar transport system permease protein
MAISRRLTTTQTSTSRARTGSLRRTKLISNISTYLLLTIVVALVLFPIYWMLITSFKMPREIMRTPTLWPELFTWRNYDELINEKEFLKYIKNSLIVAS